MLYNENVHNNRYKMLLFRDGIFLKLKLPYNTVWTAAFAVLECEAPAKSRFSNPNRNAIIWHRKYGKDSDKNHIAGGFFSS